MAYANKITTMRRMALIFAGSNIEFEGVNIEGQCFLKRVGTDHETKGWALVGHTILMKEPELLEYCKKNGLECKYQDPPAGNTWEPRKDYWEPGVKKDGGTK